MYSEYNHREKFYIANPIMIKIIYPYEFGI